MNKIDDYFVVNDCLVIGVGNEGAVVENLFESFLVDPRTAKKEKPSPAQDHPYYTNGDMLDSKFRKLKLNKSTSLGTELISRWLDYRLGSILQRPNIGLHRYRERFIDMFAEGSDMEAIDEAMEEIGKHVWRKVHGFVTKYEGDAWRYYFIKTIDTTSLMVEKNQDYRIIEFHRREIEISEKAQEGLVYKEGYYPA